jgi:hypothetical protein
MFVMLKIRFWQYFCGWTECTLLLQWYHLLLMLKIMFTLGFVGWPDMDNVETTDTTVTGASKSIKGGVVAWTNSMSTMHLGFLADLVASGARTSSGFKTCHYNQCAKFLNDHFKLSLTGEQCSNHLKKWRKIWGRLVQLKILSGALWDEDTCTIRLSDEHYAGHCDVSLFPEHFATNFHSLHLLYVTHFFIFL